MIRFENVYKEYPGGNEALHDVDLHIKRGEFVFVLGPSGAGKSTFLKLILREEKATSGRVLVGGVDVRQIDPHVLMDQVAFVFQNNRLFKASILENVRAARPNASREQVLAALEAAQCSDILEKLPQGLDTVVGTKGVYLSGGEQQRVSIARAFAVKPELLLMDEPYGQLDNSLRYKLEDELIQLWQRTGTTVIFITHNIEEAVYLSERILVLTNKPTGIKKEIKNDLPRPRDVTDAAFNELRDEVTDLIKWW